MGAKTKKTEATKKRRVKAAAVATPAAGKYDTIRADLLRQRRVLLNQVGAALSDRPDATASSDTTDQAQAEVERNFALRLHEREQKLLKKIEEAVERIDKGLFGICRGCGNEIPLPRLQARPVAEFCIECKTRQEQAENIRGR